MTSGQPRAGGQKGGGVEDSLRRGSRDGEGVEGGRMLERERRPFDDGVGGGQTRLGEKESNQLKIQAKDRRKTASWDFPSNRTAEPE